MRVLLSASVALFTCSAFGLERSIDGGEIMTETYQCERGVTIPVTYVNLSEGGAIAVLSVDGRMVTLAIAVSGSGARYVSIDEQNGYRWHIKGDEALLLYLAADHMAEEEAVLSRCTAIDR